jgi:hypothetical protein
MKKICKQRLFAWAFAVLIIAMTMASCQQNGPQTFKFVPIRQNPNDSTTGVTIGVGTGTKLKSIRVLCATKDCLLAGFTGSDTGAVPGPSKIEVSYRTAVDVPAGSVIKLELQLGPEATDQLSAVKEK